MKKQKEIFFVLFIQAMLYPHFGIIEAERKGSKKRFLKPHNGFSFFRNENFLSNAKGIHRMSICVE